ncbi:hypothetical protein QSV08_03075 [Maribacter sp. BPC-D8]|uniref:hypothetical protein n=1 Tax=Maribacter sp. BPC-D8 TaxID=3053613 RepID=UPI002B493AC7|nr:hypothetical protein [Maribacter sp. BPC-D8]WRI30226.1 hypothetical protein QSV08_03075 [Maribacter sp. BPC-D8]
MIKEGITGFNCSNLEGLSNKLELLKKNILYLKKYKIKAFYDQNETSNYVRIKLYDFIENEKIDLLINCQYGYSCCATDESSWMNIEFIEIPHLLERKLQDIFPCLKPKYLNSKLEDIDIRNLSKTEKEQIEYWKSETKGEVIFNGYD